MVLFETPTLHDLLTHSKWPCLPPHQERWCYQPFCSASARLTHNVTRYRSVSLHPTMLSLTFTLLTQDVSSVLSKLVPRDPLLLCLGQATLAFISSSGLLSSRKHTIYPPVNSHSTCALSNSCIFHLVYKMPISFPVTPTKICNFLRLGITLIIIFIILTHGNYALPARYGARHYKYRDERYIFS